MSPLLKIWGIGGADKTSACQAIAASSVTKKLYPKGTVWLKFTKDSSATSIVEDVMALVCRFCPVDDAEKLYSVVEEPEFIELAAARFHSVVDPKHGAAHIVVIDDVLDKQYALLLKLGKVLPRSTPAIFTTRSQSAAQSVPGSTSVPVHALPDADARVLLGKALRRADAERESPLSSDEEDECVSAVVDIVEHHALSLSIVVAILA